MVAIYAPLLLGKKLKLEHEVECPEPYHQPLQWLSENGTGYFDYYFPEDRPPRRIVFRFSDKETATIFKMFYSAE